MGGLPQVLQVILIYHDIFKYLGLPREWNIWHRNILAQKSNNAVLGFMKNAQIYGMFVSNFFKVVFVESISKKSLPLKYQKLLSGFILIIQFNSNQICCQLRFCLALSSLRFLLSSRRLARHSLEESSHLSQFERNNRGLLKMIKVKNSQNPIQLRTRLFFSFLLRELRRGRSAESIWNSWCLPEKGLFSNLLTAVRDICLSWERFLSKWSKWVTYPPALSLETSVSGSFLSCSIILTTSFLAAFSLFLVSLSRCFVFIACVPIHHSLIVR